MNRPLPKLSGSPPTLLVGETRAEALKAESLDLPSITLGQRQLCDLELLLNGGFSPLTGFMDEATYESVLQSLRLPDASLWPVPVTLDVDERMAQTLESGARVALRDSEGFMLAVLDVSACWKVDKDREAQSVYGTRTKRHPGVRYLHEQIGSHYVGGALEGIQLPTHYDYGGAAAHPGRAARTLREARLATRNRVPHQPPDAPSCARTHDEGGESGGGTHSHQPGSRYHQAAGFSATSRASSATRPSCSTIRTVWPPSRCCRWRRERRARGKRSGTQSCAAATAALTSSSASTTRAPPSPRPVTTPSTRRTRRRNCWGNIRRSWA